ncbi:GIY-YIG nuclease family protein [Algoriphagus resistens]|uniref:GIY-YIG nuclease family protein n=1 Tax=Algoriphagus resistens TaxID=1750590 RepID=UPI000716B3D7|nr:GIY-YIG nuclease family protein [Algoriphagus resistens]
MKTENINWYQPTEFYILTVNSFVKIGITSNWKNREITYKKEFQEIEFRKIKSYPFECRWHAELIEQVVKWRLRRWVVLGRHEYFELPIQLILDCLSDTRKELENELNPDYALE